MNASIDPGTTRPDPADEPTLVQWLSIQQVCSLGAVSHQWMVEHVRAGRVTLAGGATDPDQWQFTPTVVQRVRAIARIENQFDADPELAALVADLQEEIRRLRIRIASTL